MESSDNLDSIIWTTGTMTIRVIESDRSWPAQGVGGLKLIFHSQGDSLLHAHWNSRMLTITCITVVGMFSGFWVFPLVLFILSAGAAKQRFSATIPRVGKHI